MATCPRCHSSNNNSVANLVCKLCYRDLVLGTRTPLNTQIDSIIEDAVNS